MGVIRFEKEVPAAVAPPRMFKAFFLDAHNLLPKLVPQAIKSIDILEGDGGAGTIKVTNFAEGGKYKYAKHRIDELDKGNFRCKYTVIEGDMLAGILESIVYDVKYDASGNGGTISKAITEFHTKGDQEIKEEDLKDAEEKAMGLHKIVEAHLLANPALYA